MKLKTTRTVTISPATTTLTAKTRMIQEILAAAVTQVSTTDLLCVLLSLYLKYSWYTRQQGPKDDRNRVARGKGSLAGIQLQIVSSPSPLVRKLWLQNTRPFYHMHYGCQDWQSWKGNALYWLLIVLGEKRFSRRSCVAFFAGSFITHRVLGISTWNYTIHFRWIFAAKWIWWFAWVSCCYGHWEGCRGVQEAGCEYTPLWYKIALSKQILR